MNKKKAGHGQGAPSITCSTDVKFLFLMNVGFHNQSHQTGLITTGRYKSIEIDHRKLIDYSILLDNTR